jgi:chromosome segregation protein
MRLKKIEVLGFKSFADRQVLVVDDHVTGVIGPNGCGKSNIVDAIRWSMGEQSAKHLRGTGMADVIFAGCSTRGPAGMAEVTLTFENQGDVTATYLDQPEIAITRRLFADGTSEYLINKVPARLRDITELLTGTGAGTKGYSIIEQGQVGRIVSSKPEERRHVIDEAAGITRFKAQKAAAERKIEATRQNLLRTSDVVTELEGRLTVLRRQAQKAERYKRYKSELRDLDLWSATHKYLELQATGSVLAARRGALSTQIEDVRAALSARDGQMGAKRIELGEIERDLSERQQAVYDLDNRVQLLEAENDYRRREREQQLRGGAEARAEAEVGRRGLANVEGELEEIKTERERLGDAQGPEGAVGVVERTQAAYADAERALAEAQSAIESARIELGERSSARAGAEARRDSHREAAEAAASRLELLDGEIASNEVQIEALEIGVASAKQTSEAAAIALQDLQQVRAGLDERRALLKRQVAAAEVELDTKRAEVHRHRSRLQSLEEIQSRYRGCHSGVQVVMEHRAELEHELGMGGGGSSSGREVIHGIFADFVEAPQHLETAVSAVLGDRLEGVVVDAPAIAAKGIELLKREQEGRTTFVPRTGGRGLAPTMSERDRFAVAKSGGGKAGRMFGLGDGPSDGKPIGWGWSPAADYEVVDFIAPAGGLDDPGARTFALLRDEAGVIGRLSDLVTVTGDLGPLGRAMLGDAIVVESLQRALELWEQNRCEATLVTLDGDRLEPTGVLVGGSPTALNAALLQQKREIRELGEILVLLDADFEAARARHLAFAQDQAEVEAAREQSEADVIAAEKRKLQAQGDHDRLCGELDRVGAELRGQHERAAVLRDELQTRRREIGQLDDNLVLAAERIAELERTIGTEDARSRALIVERDRLASELTEAKIALARWQQQSDALVQSEERLLRQAESERQRMTRLDEVAAAAERRVAELDEATEAARVERESLLQRSREATAGVHAARERYDAMRLEIDELEASMKTLRGDLDERRETMNEVELGLQEINLERQHLVGDMRERFDAEVAEVLVDFHDRPLCGPAEKARQVDLKRILMRMGEVNLTAIDEFEEVQNRFTYLSGQKADLEHAISQLQEAIDRINKTTRKLFKETFDAVNERFQLLFPRLFGGGAAQLKMTNPEDLLVTGVEIEAKPPGKQPRTLDLLSGGEKALTAVSLIFAIFLIKPSPFCLLDEVDAPLDDANVGRFCNLVRELSSNTQFIIITHNKGTMETADRLYGVTMEQRGVSKMVSVNLRRAVEIAYN